MAKSTDRSFAASIMDWQRNPLARIGILLVLIVVTQFPIGMISDLIGTRAKWRDEAAAAVTNSWGGPDRFAGPVLVIPYVRRAAATDDKFKQPEEIREDRYFLPDVLDVDGTLVTGRRQVGFFDFSVFVSKIKASGSFERPGTENFPDGTTQILWNQAWMAITFDNPRTLRDTVSVAWQGAPAKAEAGIKNLALFDNGVHVRAPISQDDDGPLSFDFELAISASDEFSVLPVGAKTNVRLTGDWHDVRFGGAYPPRSSEIREAGFEASWAISSLSRGFPAVWTRGDVQDATFAQSWVSVRLLTPIDAYRSAGRAQDYHVMFVALTFLTLWLIELMNGFRVHPVQYLLISAALCLFYLLLLSLAEHLGFMPAYAMAASSIIALVAGYSRAVFGGRVHAAMVAAVVSALYLYLFVLLRIERYALLVGSYGLLAALAAVMFLTRKIDWFSLHDGRLPEFGEPERSEAAENPL